MTAAADDYSAVEPAEETRERRRRLRAQVFTREDERQSIVGEAVAPAQGKPQAGFGLDDSEAGDCLAGPSDELGGALHGIATEEPCDRRTAAHLAAKNPQKRRPSHVDGGVHALTMFVDERELLHA